MKVVVTGANGNLGSHLSKMASGYNMEIVPVTRAEWGNIDNIIDDTVDAVIHAAGDIRSLVSVTPVQYLNSNIITTSRLLELCVASSISKFYFISSCAVYGDVNSTTETQCCSPASLNGKLKKLNEDIISEFCNKNNINYTCFRVFNLFGGDDQFSIVNYLTKAINGQAEFTLNNEGISQRDFIHVSDVAEIILKMVSLDEFPLHLNVGTGMSIKISDLLNIVKNRYPDISVKRTYHHEIEYSRADTTQLFKYIQKEFISIIDYVEKI